MKYTTLHKKVKEDMHIKFLTLRTKMAIRYNVGTISAVFIMACRKVFPEYTVVIEHSLGRNLCGIRGKKSPSAFKRHRKIRGREKILEGDIPIIRKRYLPKKLLII